MFYLAISSSQPDFKPESLTPRFMLWRPGIWLLDLGPVWAYWCHQAGSHDLHDHHDLNGLHGFLRQAISALAGQGVVAVLDANPWRALLGMEVMCERGLDGFVSAQNALGRNLVNEASWDIWFRLADEVAAHWFGTRRERFNLQVFRRQARQMALGMERLGIRKPADLGGIPALAIRRRYGAPLHDLWLWSHEAPSAPGAPGAPRIPSIDDGSPAGFPWVLWRQEQAIQVKRHLDTPLLEWEHMEIVLREDVDRLCALLNKQGAGRILSLEWRVVFLDLSCLVIPIRFRHPHDLPAEFPHYRTALLQACYAFEDAIPAAMGAAVDLGVYEKAIGSWDLMVTEKINLPPVMRDLFGSVRAANEAEATDDAEGVAKYRLQQLENRLSVPLSAYEVTANWIPEEGYKNVQKNMQPNVEPYTRPSLRALGLRRPLFVYPKPRSSPQPANQSRAWVFCERIMDKWWRSGSASGQESTQRDYYMMRDQEQRAVWVFKDGAGKWYVHGMYN